MLTENPIVLKEWSVLCTALRHGRQLALVRKGGIAEGPGGFQVEHPEFWLLPTRFHQSADELTPEVASLLTDAAIHPPPAGQLRIDLYAEVRKLYRIENEADLPRLQNVSGLADKVLHNRFHYRRPGLTVLLLRVYERSSPFFIDDLPDYAGCHSWVTLQSPLSTAGLAPVIADQEFNRQRQEIAARLDGSEG